MVIITCPGMVSNGFAQSLERPGGIDTGMEDEWVGEFPGWAVSAQSTDDRRLRSGSPTARDVPISSLRRIGGTCGVGAGAAAIGLTLPADLVAEADKVLA